MYEKLTCPNFTQYLIEKYFSRILGANALLPRLLHQLIIKLLVYRIAVLNIFACNTFLYIWYFELAVRVQKLYLPMAEQAISSSFYRQQIINS